MTGDHWKICTAIIGLVVLECVALLTGHNGTVLRLVIIAIAGLGGFSLARFLTLTKTPKPHPQPGDFLNR